LAHYQCRRVHRVQQQKPQYRDFRAGDVRHSLADVSKSKALLGYDPEFSVKDGLDKAANWYMNFFK
jgi:UDP-N-acetylglucosamine 4-epimerase